MGYRAACALLLASHQLAVETSSLFLAAVPLVLGLFAWPVVARQVPVVLSR
jgi:hypothetical protein